MKARLGAVVVGVAAGSNGRRRRRADAEWLAVGRHANAALVHTRARGRQLVPSAIRAPNASQTLRHQNEAIATEQALEPYMDVEHRYKGNDIGNKNDNGNEYRV